MQPWTWSQKPKSDASCRKASGALHPDSLFTLVERASLQATCEVRKHYWLVHAVFMMKEPGVKAVS